jgi:hypothetical protein
MKKPPANAEGFDFDQRGGRSVGGGSEAGAGNG